MTLDLDAYLGRIDHRGSPPPTRDGLHALHLAHATHIPFENLDILLDRPIRLDLESLQAKLVENRRGGYCFEQNTLFAAALEALGFRVTRLAARVRFGVNRLLPRTHMVLAVEVEGESWLADVGFGGEGLLLPVPLDGREARHFAWTYRVVPEGSALVLQTRRPDGWFDLYAFTPEPQEPIDYEVANWFTSTHPASIFVQTLTAQLPTPEVRYVLRGRQYTEGRSHEMTTRTIATDEELLTLLAARFGLHFPADTRFRGLERVGCAER